MAINHYCKFNHNSSTLYIYSVLLLLNINNNDLATSGPKTDNYVTGIRFGKICVISYNHESGGVVKNHEYQLTTVSKFPTVDFRSVISLLIALISSG